MEKKAKILYAEDDDTLAFLTCDNLEQQQYEVQHCSDGKKCIEMFSTNQYDICILDIMLPGTDGFTIAQFIRDKNKDIPIIFLSAKTLKEDKLHGLKIGADDYLVKPFSIEELVLKIEIFLKRSGKTGNTENVLTVGHYRFDTKNYLLQIDNTSHTLTKREADLLRMLANNPNKVVERETILKALWGDDDYFMGRSLDVFISRLRKLLSQDPTLTIQNVHGVGFRLVMSQ